MLHTPPKEGNTHPPPRRLLHKVHLPFREIPGAMAAGIASRYKTGPGGSNTPSTVNTYPMTYPRKPGCGSAARNVNRYRNQESLALNYRGYTLNTVSVNAKSFY